MIFQFFNTKILQNDAQKGDFWKTFENVWTYFVTASLKIDGFSKMPANSLNSSIFRNLN